MGNRTYICEDCGALRRARDDKGNQQFYLPHRHQTARCAKCRGVLSSLTHEQSVAARKLQPEDRLVWLRRGGHITRGRRKGAWTAALSDRDIERAEEEFESFRRIQREQSLVDRSNEEIFNQLKRDVLIYEVLRPAYYTFGDVHDIAALPDEGSKEHPQLVRRLLEMPRVISMIIKNLEDLENSGYVALTAHYLQVLVGHRLLPVTSLGDEDWARLSSLLERAVERYKSPSHFGTVIESFESRQDAAAYLWKVSVPDEDTLNEIIRKFGKDLFMQRTYGPDQIRARFKLPES